MIFQNNKTYDILKWCCMIAIPAICTAVTQLGQLFGWADAVIVSEVGVIACTCLGTLLGISNYQYYQQNQKPDDSVYYIDGFDVEEQDHEEEGMG